MEVPKVMNGLTITFTDRDAPANMLIAASYKGTLEYGAGSNDPSQEENFTVTIKAQEDGKVEISLDDFGSGAMGFTGVVIPNIEVSEKSGEYVLAGEIDATSGGTTKITGSLEGTVKDGKANIVFTMKPGAMPVNIIATFTM
ncbi:MAG: calycin-like domain-containing protein [Bacteroides sp.]|nr:calycin-like domain-containing protein [Bacteroides sp.]